MLFYLTAAKLPIVSYLHFPLRTIFGILYCDAHVGELVPYFV
jgi:hypothetical protein